MPRFPVRAASFGFVAIVTLFCAVDGAQARGARSVLFAPAAFVPDDCDTPPYDDVAIDHPFCPYIQLLKADQVTLGCGGSDYCPDNPVTRAQLAELLEKAMRGTATWTPGSPYKRTVIVSPVPGDPAASGAALLAALAAIVPSACTGAVATDDRWLLHLEPGYYELGTGTLLMKPCVDIEGSGELSTMIHAFGNDTSSEGTVVAANRSELRSLTVASEFGSFAIALVNAGTQDFRAHHLRAMSIGSPTTQNWSILNSGALRSVLEDLTIYANSGLISIGVRNQSMEEDAHLALRRLAILVGSDGNAYGVYNDDADVHIGDVIVEHTVNEADTAAGVYSKNSTVRLAGIDVRPQPSGSSEGTFTDGILNDSAVTFLERSVIAGSTSLKNLAPNGGTFFVKNVRVFGLLTNLGGGSFTCVDVQDEILTPVVCP